MRKLSNFIVVSTLGLTTFMVLLIYVLITVGYEQIVEHRTEKHAKTVADITYNGLYHLMKQGGTRQDVSELLESNRKLFTDTRSNVVVYQSESIARQFGRPYEAVPDRHVLEVFTGGVARSFTEGNFVRHLYPLIASANCSGCHTAARNGEVIGVIDSRINIGHELRESRSKILIFLAFLTLIPLSAAITLAGIMKQRVRKSVTDLHQRIQGVNKISDLRLFEVEDLHLGFVEFKVMFDEIKKVFERLRGMAIDKDVLEFEVKLLERFIITSEVVRDWKDHVNHILIEINTFLNTYFFFSLFMVGDDTYDMEVFWRNKPSERVKKILEAIIRDKLAKSPRFQHVQQLTIIHNIALPLASLPELKEEDIELQTKALFLEAPRIGGIVGIGAASEVGQYPARALVIESILATLLNVVGSVKAIYRYTKELEFYSTRDPLTNLCNQRMFWELLENEIERAVRHDYQFALLLIDIDNFKMVNDSYGHTVGDKVLQEVSTLIKAALRAGDVPARYDGDEFAVIIPEADGQQAYLVAKRIMDDLKQHSVSLPDGGTLRCSVSIGISIFPSHAKSSKELFMMADNMRYRSKTLGKDQVSIPTDYDLAEVYRMIGEKNILIMRAIAERSIVPYFQPIVNVGNGLVEAHEVLMRINLPEKMMSAGEFIDIAEGMGVISKMDHILMDKAFEQVQATGYQGLLFINISPKALILNEFIPSVRMLTQRYGIEPANIVFEITERETVKNLTLLERFVLDLKFENYKFAIDDFGSGFSSYQYLKRFPVDFIKVEGDFVRGMAGGGAMDRSIVRSIATLAQGLGIQTVGEYVEDAGVLQAVMDAGLTFAQGYHVGRPSPELFSGNRQDSIVGQGVDKKTDVEGEGLA